MRKGSFEIVIKRHAFVRALQRKIAAELIERTLQSGKMLRFGKNRVRFEKRFRHYSIICVDEITGNIIKILTIVKRRW